MLELGDTFEPHNLERLRRSIAMLPPGRPDGLDRDLAIRIIEELQRLQRGTRAAQPARCRLGVKRAEDRGSERTPQNSVML